MTQNELFETMFSAWKEKKETGKVSNPLLPQGMNGYFERLAESMGLKRGTDEWNRFIYDMIDRQLSGKFNN